MNIQEALGALTRAIDALLVELRINNQWNKAIYDELRALRAEAAEEVAENDKREAPPE